MGIHLWFGGGRILSLVWWSSPLSLLLLFPIAFWYWWWWRAFVAEYLRLDRPNLITAALLTVAGLTAVAIIAYLPGSSLSRELGWLFARP